MIFKINMFTILIIEYSVNKLELWLIVTINSNTLTSWPIQLTFSQCITPVPNFFHALWDFMQDQMCHIVWPSMTSAKNVMLPTWYYYLCERNYYQKKIESSLSDWVCLNNAACAHLEVSMFLGPETHAISSPQKVICYFWGLNL